MLCCTRWSWREELWVAGEWSSCSNKTTYVECNGQCMAKKNTIHSLVATGIKGEKVILLWPQCLSTCGASLKWRSMRVSGRIPPLGGDTGFLKWSTGRNCSSADELKLISNINLIWKYVFLVQTAFIFGKIIRSCNQQNRFLILVEHEKHYWSYWLFRKNKQNGECVIIWSSDYIIMSQPHPALRLPLPLPPALQ